MSNEVAIAVENLGKSYRIRHAAKRATTLVGAMKSAASAPFKYLGEKMRAADESEIFWALKDVSFEVRRGEVVGIVGRNGAGKSTLLKILSRITDPSVGRAQIHGRVNALLEVGTGFHEELSGRENVYMNAALHGLRKAEIDGKFDEIVDFSGVEKFIDTPVKRYSSGMRVRLGFAVAASLEPDILVVDEVLAVGDLAFQRKCLGKMGAVAESGRTVLFVSHQMPVVESLCSRGILLADGGIVADGPARDVVARYVRNAYETSANTGIAARTDREGNGRFRFMQVWLCDENGVRVPALTPGRPGAIHAVVEPKTNEAVLKDAVASLVVRDANATRLFTMAASLKNIAFTLDGASEIVWKIPKLQLTEDDYRCDLYLAAQVNYSSDEVVDRVIEAFVLPVSGGDFYGNGRAQARGIDRFYLDFDVSVRSV